MTRLFGRRWSFLLDDMLFEGQRLGGGYAEGVRVSFTVKRTAKPEPNTLDMEVYNLSPETRASIRKGTRVILNAGYEGTLQSVFVGEVQRVRTRHEGTETVTKLSVGDGARAYTGATTSVGLAKGAGIDEAVKRMAATLGVDSTRALERLRAGDIPAELRSLPRGYVASGKSSAELTKLVRRAGLDWSIQDGQLQVLAPKEVLPGQAVLLREDTGLLEAPEPNDSQENEGPPTTTLKSLMQPYIRPGTALKVESQYVTGFFRGQSVKHVGDSHGDAWYTEVEALAL